MKILLIGPGPDRLGKTGGLDRLAIQGRRFLLFKDHQLIWLDSNPTAVMSSPVKGCQVYLEPLDLDTIARVIERERPQALMYDFGGRLAQHLTLFLEREGVLDRSKVKTLGMPVEGLRKFLDDETLHNIMHRIGLPVIQTKVGHSLQEGLNLSNQLGFPLLLKQAFALEGIGGRLLFNQEEAVQAIRYALQSSPVSEIILQKLPMGWSLAGVESLHTEPSPGTTKLLGTWSAQGERVEQHPGNTLLRSPAPALNKELCHRVLEWSASLASETRLVGCLRLELAISPNGEDIAVLRARPGVSWLSAWLALLSDFPLGRIAAGAALGLTWGEMIPAGLQPMKQVQNGVRLPMELLDGEPKRTTSPTLQAVGAVVKIEPDYKAALAGVDESLSAQDAGIDELLLPAEPGFSEETAGVAPDDLTALIPCCEPGDDSQWWFMGGLGKSPPADKRDPNSLLILGPGHYRIGWGAELDVALWHTAHSLKKLGKSLVLINNNPEAVSLDSWIFDRICLEAPSAATIAAALDRWPIGGVIHQFCPEIPIGLSRILNARGVEVLGTPLKRRRLLTDWISTSQTLAELGVPLREHVIVGDRRKVLDQASQLGYPILVRLTYTWLNPAGEIVYSPKELAQFVRRVKNRINESTPLYIEKFQDGIVGAQLLTLCDGERAVCPELVENIEDYGVHSGDCAATIVPLSIDGNIKGSALRYLQIIINQFGVVGHLKMELAVASGHCYLAGLWPFPSQNLAMTDKDCGYNPYALTAGVFAGGRFESVQINRRADGYQVKEAVFPFQFLPGMDPALSPRMKSTGQVLGRDRTIGRAFYKSQLASYPELPGAGCVFISARDNEKEATLNICRRLRDMGFQLMSTHGTSRFLRAKNLAVEEIAKLSEGRPNIVDMMKNGEVCMTINIPGGLGSKKDEAMIRLAAVERNLPLFTTIAEASLMVEGMEEIRRFPLELSPLDGCG